MRRITLLAVTMALAAAACGDGGTAADGTTGITAAPETTAAPEISGDLDRDDGAGLTYPIVGTGQAGFYDDRGEIEAPAEGEPFAGQDAAYPGTPASYRDNGDGTVTDLVTGLTWAADPGEKVTFAAAVVGADDYDLAGYDDWRLPTIEELYSLIDFSGSSVAGIPYLDTGVFAFSYGDEAAGDRIIDAQYWSATEYVGTVFDDQAAAFGVNFADGRIKAYPTEAGPGGMPTTAYARYVRGNPAYGENDFVAGGDGTVTDLATGLRWQQADSSGHDWEEALAVCEALDLGGSEDWRLPDAKELQSIVDYTRSPATTGTAAIDPVFTVGDPEAWYWTGTTLLETPPEQGVGSQAVYLAFGTATGIYDGEAIDVHGAGAQRGDPKSGDASQYPDGRGPQNDEIRIENAVRCVTDA